MRIGKYTFNQADFWKTVEWSLVSAAAGFLTYFGANVIGVDSVWGPLLSTAAVAAAKALQRLLTPSDPPVVPTPVVPVPTPVVPTPGPLPSPGSVPGPAIFNMD